MGKYEIDANFVSYTRDALLKCFWYKRDLLNFLVAIDKLSPSYFSIKKREFLTNYFNEQIKNDAGKKIICDIALTLRKRTDFPELKQQENSQQMIEKAKEAIRVLNKYLLTQEEASNKEEDIKRKREENAKRQKENIKKLSTKETLKESFEKIAMNAGTQDGGYELENWFYELAKFEKIQSQRPPYKNKDGRQVDGSITIDGTTYLLEIKNTKGETPVRELDHFKIKVERGIDNTMGIMLSLSGFSQQLIQDASQKGSKILLLDYNHIYYYFTHEKTLAFIINRIREHASQTGEAYLDVKKF